MTPVDSERQREHELPVVDPDDLSSPDGEPPRVAGVLLAAGTGSRFEDGNKLLVDLDGDPLVRRAATTLVAAGLDPLVAVVGHEADRVREALAGLAYEIVDNPGYERGQATSVAAGLEALTSADVDGDVDAVVFALGDMPFVAPTSVEALVAAYRAGAGSALAAACDGVRGNPVLFDAEHFPTLADVEGDVGGREVLLDGEESALVETGDAGVRLDVDTAADLREGRERRGRHGANGASERT